MMNVEKALKTILDTRIDVGVISHTLKELLGDWQQKDIEYSLDDLHDTAFKEGEEERD